MISDLFTLTGVHCQDPNRMPSNEIEHSIEALIFKSIQDENNRRGGWVRLFPTSDTWEFYSQYLEVRTTSYNSLLHQKLFPKRWTLGNIKRLNVSRAK